MLSRIQHFPALPTTRNHESLCSHVLRPWVIALDLDSLSGTICSRSPQRLTRQQQADSDPPTPQPDGRTGYHKIHLQGPLAISLPQAG